MNLFFKSKISFIPLSTGLFLAGCASSPLVDPTTSLSAGITQVQANSEAVTTTLVAQNLASGAIMLAKADRIAEDSFTPFVTPAEMQFRLLSLQGLLDYANALKTLAAIDGSSDVQKTGDAVKSDMDATIKDLKSLPKSQVPDVTGVLDAFSQLSELIETALLGHERDAALRRALQSADPSVGRICDIFAGEMESPSDALTHLNGHHIFYDELEGTFRTQLGDLSQQFDAAHKKADDKAALSIATSYTTTDEKKQYTLALCRAIGVAFEDVKKAHSALAVQAETGQSSRAAFDTLKSQLQIISLYSEQIKNIGGK